MQKYLLFFFQILAHAGLLYFIFHFNWSGFLTIFIFYFLFTAVGSDITYHRLLAHGSFKAPRWFFLAGNIFGALGGVGSPIAWVANHRAHHKFVDTPKDPHSPRFKGAFKIYFLSMFEPINIKYGVRLLENKTLIFFHKYYWIIHILYFLILLFLFPKGIIWMYLAPAALTWSMSASINYFCHKTGYRVVNTKDTSTNNFLIGLLSFGEGWHNYHHAHPEDYRCGHQKWEIDIAAKAIELFKLN